MKDFFIMLLYFSSLSFWIVCTTFLALKESHYIFVGILGLVIFGSMELKVRDKKESKK